MKNISIFLAITFLAVVFSGCASDGLAVNTLSGNHVARYFKEGVVLNQKKVIIDDKELAILSGATVAGAGVGMVAKSTQNGLIGAVVGGFIGAVVGREVQAYETIIGYDGNKRQTCYLDSELPTTQSVEFTIKETKCKNVNILKEQKDIYKQATNITTTKQVIHRLIKRNGIWFYEFRDGIVLNSNKYFPYKNKIVVVKYNNATNSIISINKI